MQCSLLAIALVLSSSTLADEKPNLRALELTGVQLVYPDRLTEPKPVEITTANDLANAKQFADDASRTAIKKQVDFEKEKLVVFTWSGSGGDRLTPEVKVQNGKTTIVFLYKVGFTDDFRQHGKVYAVQKDAAVEVKK